MAGKSVVDWGQSDGEILSVRNVDVMSTQDALYLLLSERDGKMMVK